MDHPRRGHEKKKAIARVQMYFFPLRKPRETSLGFSFRNTTLSFE
jgi:hypothetical protein